MERIEINERCKDCGGTGLYVGMAEHDGAAIVCYNCKGTGCHHFVYEYVKFTCQAKRTDTTRVFEVNVGIMLGGGDLAEFGGVSYEAWRLFINKAKFPPARENRKYACPCWWYQCADYNRKPDWPECQTFNGTFSGCKCFPNKHKCWEKFDKANNPSQPN